MNSLLKKIQQLAICSIVLILCVSCSKVPTISNNPWKVIQLPTDATFASVAFTSNPNHGWLVGTKASLFETQDGGNTWEAKSFDLEGEKASFNAVSFSGDEGWITGKPAILLHTQDGGKNWNRIALSSKLPGSPAGIIALGQNTAEMVTDLGAIYKTKDGGQSWKALVEGAVGVARNIERSRDGQYIAVSANGNFYSTWKPGDSEWTPHNRNSSRRLQNMGFTPDQRLWLIARGGQIQLSEPQTTEKWEDPITPELSTSWGFLSLGYRNDDELWVAGGSGNLLRSVDRGVTWEKDREVEEVPSNLYKVLFINPNQGFVLGQQGYILKYDPQSQNA